MPHPSVSLDRQSNMRYSGHPLDRVAVRLETRVATCYDLLDLTRFGSSGGIIDYTDGIYGDDPDVPYELAQERQSEFLLDEIGCGAGSRILDLGCGNGRILESAKRRGATATGISIAARQVSVCREKGLDARLMDYREIDRHFYQEFDGIIANGSIEHFVQPRDAASGLAEGIYQNLFELCHHVLDPASPSRRVATTTIHFGRVQVTPQEAMTWPFHYRWGSDRFHYSLLSRAFGGYYPSAGQLEKCASPYFVLRNEIDGTRDYLRTSEHWLSIGMRSLSDPRFLWRLVGRMMRHPIQGPRLSLCFWIARSWNWQFRGDLPPMRLLRQTWQAR